MGESGGVNQFSKPLPRPSRRGQAAWKEFKAKAFRALDRPGTRKLLAIVAAVHASIKARRLCRVRHEQWWIHEFPNGILVEPRPRLRVLPDIELTVKDMWMHEYAPSKGDIVFDIGAGTGWETLCFSRRVGKSGRVISIEGHPGTFACLAEMCRRNKLQNVTLINCAIMDGPSEVFISDDNDFAQNNVFDVKSGIPVQGRTLDSIGAPLSRIDLLKCNIEGAERIALKGMTKVIRKVRHVSISCHDFLADEGSSELMRSKAEVIAFLEQNGFEIVQRSSDPRPWIRDCVYARNCDWRPGQIGAGVEGISQVNVGA